MEYIILNSILFLLSLGAAFVLVKNINAHAAFQKLNRNVEKINKSVQKSANKRKRREEELRIEDGGQEKTSFFYKIDLSLVQSGITEKLPFLNTEIFLGVVMGCMAFGFIVCMAVKNNMVLAVVTASLTAFFFYLVIFILTGVNYRRTEAQIVTFVGMMKNYSRTSDDLLTIFKSVSDYLDEPLKSVVADCCMEAENTGDMDAAVTRMALKVEHKEFKKIVNSLLMCSSHKANYGEIIARNMDQLRSYLAAKEEEKRMVNSARATICMIIGVGVLCTYMLNDLAEGSVIHYLSQTMVGNLILLYLFFVIFYAVWKMVSMGRKE